MRYLNENVKSVASCVTHISKVKAEVSKIKKLIFDVGLPSITIKQKKKSII